MVVVMICDGKIFVFVNVLMFDFNVLSKVKLVNLFNCVFFEVYEFGFISKFMIVVVVLEEGVVMFLMLFIVLGYISCVGKVFYDLYDYVFEWLMFVGVFVKFSNVGMIMVGEKLLLVMMYWYLIKFGIG